MSQSTPPHDAAPLALDDTLEKALFGLVPAHPWHGVAAASEREAIFNAFIELVPSDTVKYELDKESGHLRLDRPQQYSSLCPSLYGFIPRTLCGPRVAQRCMERTGQRQILGDNDPMDVCVLTEKSAAHGNFFACMRPIGGLRMVDGDEADDKIIAVLESDITYGHITDIDQLTAGVVDRLQHYFLSYKQQPNNPAHRVSIPEIYGRSEALEVMRYSMLDYQDSFGTPDARLQKLREVLLGGGPPRGRKKP